ncbi:hypothetical protein ACFQ9X_06785 [Catenulispora yoronensis]
MSMWLTLAPIPADRASVVAEDFAKAFGADYRLLTGIGEDRAEVEADVEPGATSRSGPRSSRRWRGAWGTAVRRSAGTSSDTVRRS